MKNQWKTVMLLTGIGALFLFIGYSFGGQAGMTMALVMALVMNVGAYWFSDKIVLAMHRAQPLHAGHPSGVYEMLEELCERAALPMPKVYIVPTPAPNAFATGRNPRNSAVAVTEGILHLLNPRELRAVLAHEISHIGNRDILVSTIAASIASAVMYLAHMLQWTALFGGNRDGERGGMNPIAMLATVLLAPLAATLIRAAVSRTREFMADETGAHICQDPDALASALRKISDPSLVEALHHHGADVGQAAFAHMYIANHLSGEGMMNLFSTHPPVNERIKRLAALGTRGGRRRF